MRRNSTGPAQSPTLEFSHSSEWVTESHCGLNFCFSEKFKMSIAFLCAYQPFIDLPLWNVSLILLPSFSNWVVFLLLICIHVLRIFVLCMMDASDLAASAVLLLATSHWFLVHSTWRAVVLLLLAGLWYTFSISHASAHTEVPRVVMTMDISCCTSQRCFSLIYLWRRII